MLKRLINRARLAAVPFVFKKVSAPAVDVRHERVERPFSRHHAGISSQKVAEVFDAASRTVDHVERIAALDGDYCIDPSSGFVMRPGTRAVLKEAIIYDHPSVYPAMRKHDGHRETRIDEVVQFDHHWGITYFHFYSDVLHKLWMLDAWPGLVPDVPLVVSRRTFESKWFRFFRQFPEVALRRWLVQEPNETIRAKRVWVLRSMPFEPSYWHRTRSLVERFRKPVTPGRRVFINRPSTIGRYVDNVPDLVPVLERRGFEIVELDHATMERQVELFSSAAVVVSMHGAALTNLIYSGAPTRVLELIPDEEISCHYYWVADVMQLGGYDVVLGGPLRKNRLRYPRGKFSVDPALFAARLDRTLEGAA